MIIIIIGFNFISSSRNNNNIYIITNIQFSLLIF